MSRFLELFEDDDKQLSMYRAMFLFGCVGIFSLATAQFFSVGSIPIALYTILAGMTSGGYIGGKYVDSKYAEFDTTPDATDGNNDAP